MPSRKKKGNEEPMEVDQVDDNMTTANGPPPEEEFLVDGDADRMSEDEEGGIRMGGVYIPPAPKPALTFDATGPRLLITHIVNENFKSYAGVQTLGPFHKSFTAIIGPNGSGKSNVIDSMLFVFGYRATKIRSKKISVLIHSSSKHPNITSASVAVHFCQIIDGTVWCNQAEVKLWMKEDNMPLKTGIYLLNVWLITIHYRLSVSYEINNIDIFLMHINKKDLCGKN